jgi:hypothetical protein
MDLLYHYCSNETFLSIVGNGSIWLSSLDMSNDSLEGKMVEIVLQHIGQQDGLDASQNAQLLDEVRRFNQFISGYAFCMSEEGDLLSQWRGYAQNASGVAIGFSRGFFSNTPFNSVWAAHLAKVEYDFARQCTNVMPTYQKLKGLIDDGALRTPGRRGVLDVRTDEEVESDDALIKERLGLFVSNLAGMVGQLFSLKSHAFREEREWRYLSLGAHTANPNEKLKYRAAGSKIVAYQNIDISSHLRDAVKEVILGPKNETPESVVEDFLRSCGLEQVEVIKSKASYR